MKAAFAALGIARRGADERCLPKRPLAIMSEVIGLGRVTVMPAFSRSLLK
jgi:hypothetical protein